jgi:hypothetical protein
LSGTSDRLLAETMIRDRRQAAAQAPPSRQS